MLFSAGTQSASPKRPPEPAPLPSDMSRRNALSASSSMGQSDEDDYSWIPWFCSLKGNEFFCEVEESYVQDSFNLTGLDLLIAYYDNALDLILDLEARDDMLSDDQQEILENDAETLFGLIHARYILTSKGLQRMLIKYREKGFGTCPNVMCMDQPVLPVGLSDALNEESVKLFCPRCNDVYEPRRSRHQQIDGAYFGRTFPHLFFLQFPELKPPPTNTRYEAKVFGYKVHKDAYKLSLEAQEKAREAKRAPKLRPLKH